MSGQPLAAQDLTDLFPLSFRHQRYMTPLDLAQAFKIVDLGLGAGIVAGGHRKAVRDEVGQPEDQDHLG